MSRARNQVIHALVTLIALTLTTSAIGQDSKGAEDVKDAKESRPCSFTPLQLAVPAGSTISPSDINDSGAVIGTTRVTNQLIPLSGFLARRGKFVKFNFPGATDTRAEDLNNHGVIVGSFDSASFSGQRGFIADSRGIRQIQIPGFPDAPATADAINDRDDIAGSFNGNGTNFGYLLHKGRLTVLSFPGAKGGTFPLSINNDRTIVGVYRVDEEDGTDQGFVWKNGVFFSLTTPEGFTVRATKVNDRGVIVGEFLDASLNEHGFSLVERKFSVIDAPGAIGTAILGLNNHDNVIAVSAGLQGNTFLLGNCKKAF